jgi:hypothetical protein
MTDRVVGDVSSDVMQQGRRPEKRAVDGLVGRKGPANACSRIGNGKAVLRPWRPLAARGENFYGFLVCDHRECFPGRQRPWEQTVSQKSSDLQAGPLSACLANGSQKRPFLAAL